MKIFNHINLPEQFCPPLGMSPLQQLVEELKNIQKEANEKQQPNYFLDNLFNRLNDSYLEHKEKQAKLHKLIKKLSQKYGEENINFRKLKDGLLTFFLVKSLRDLIYAPLFVLNRLHMKRFYGSTKTS